MTSLADCLCRCITNAICMAVCTITPKPVKQAFVGASGITMIVIGVLAALGIAIGGVILPVAAYATLIGVGAGLVGIVILSILCSNKQKNNQIK